MIPPIREWLPRHYVLDPTSQRQGTWDHASCPMLSVDGGPLWAIEQSHHREIVLKTPAQAGKTVIAQGALLYWFATDPGPAMWVLPAADEGQTFFESRLGPSLRQSPQVRRLLPSGRYAQKATEIQFPYGLFLLVGANSGSKLSGKPVRYLICDEEKDYPTGALEKAAKRARSYGRTCRILRVSTPKEPGQDIDAGFHAGSQHSWRPRCPVCGEAHPVSWSRIAIDESLPTFDRRLASMRILCPCGRHEWRDTPADRMRLAKEGAWIAGNPDAPAHIYSATWSSLVVPWASWRDILMEHERASAAFKRGLPAPMAVFFQETLGEAWTPAALEDEEPLPVGHFAKGDEWQPEAYRFLAADVQRDRLEVVARQAAEGGESRLLYEGTVATFDDLKALADALQIKPQYVAVDSRYRRPEVLTACQRWGWTAMMGEDRDNGYTHVIRNRAMGREEKVRRPYSAPQRVDVGVGTDRRGLYCWQLSWSNRQIKDVLALMSAGKGTPWWVAGDASQDYREQMRSEVIREVADPDTGTIKTKWVKRHRDRDNHRWDCECMILVLMLAADGGRCLGSAEVAPPQEQTLPSGLDA